MLHDVVDSVPPVLDVPSGRITDLDWRRDVVDHSHPMKASGWMQIHLNYPAWFRPCMAVALAFSAWLTLAAFLA